MVTAGWLTALAACVGVAALGSAEGKDRVPTDVARPASSTAVEQPAGAWSRSTVQPLDAATMQTAQPAAPAPAPRAAPAGAEDPDVVIAKALDPYRWVRGHGSALLVYQPPPKISDGAIDEVGAIAVSLVRPDGSVLRRWTQPDIWEDLEWSPVRGGFVGYGAGAVFIGPRGVTSLKVVHGKRAFRPGDVRFGNGRLLNLKRKTVTRERLPSNCGAFAGVDLRGRMWCLDGPRRTVSWSDDGRTWARHTLSTSYSAECDGGTLGADVEVLGPGAVIGLWRADFTSDRGKDWQDVALPYKMVGADDGIGTPYEANCTHVDLVRGGRLHMSYFQHAAAPDASASSFVRVAKPRNAGRLDYRTYEGILVAPLRRQHGERVVSYDGGTHWRPLRVRPLLRHLFEQT